MCVCVKTLSLRLPGGAHGWSTKATVQASSQTLTDDEVVHIKKTLQLAQHYQDIEALRVRYENLCVKYMLGMCEN